MGRIVIVTGPPGAGKSTVTAQLARDADGPLGMHMHTDDLYAYVKKGFVEPWRPESQAQNVTLMQAMAASAAICARGGYEVFVDGIVGPWFLDPWRQAAANDGLDLRYIVLMPGEGETVARGVGREGHPMRDEAVIRQMWRAFVDFAPEPRCVLDTSGQTAAETAAVVRAGLTAGDFKLR